MSVTWRSLLDIKCLLLVFLLLQIGSLLTLLLWTSSEAACQRNKAPFLFQACKEANHAVSDKAKVSFSAKENSKRPNSIMDTVCHPRKDQCYSFIATRVAQASSSGTTQSSTVCVSELGITESARGIGFASLLLMTLDHISFCLLSGGKPVVYWRGGLSFIRSKLKNPLLNSWSLFFEPPSMNTENEIEEAICLGRFLHVPDFQRITPRANISYLRNLKTYFKPKPVINLKFRKPSVRNLSHIDFEGVISTDTKLWMNSLLKKFIKVKEPIKEKVERFYHKFLHGHYILGVHTRGTDHILETELRRLPKLELWVREAEMIYSSMPFPKRIFVASDNLETVEKFVAHFGRDAVLFTSSLRALKYDGPDIQQSLPPLQQLATEVLIDVLLLSKCHHFLHGESSVSALAHYFNPHMKSYFLGELTTNKNIKLVNYANEDSVVDMDEEEQDYSEMVKQHKKNSHTSVCPNMRSSHFLPDSQLGSFFKP